MLCFLIPRNMMSDNGPNLWETLPEECKSMILSRLTNKEAARIARVSFEFLLCKFENNFHISINCCWL